MLAVFALGLGLIVGALFLLLSLPLLSSALQSVTFLMVAMVSCIGLGLCVSAGLMVVVAHSVRALAGSSSRGPCGTREKEVAPYAGLLTKRPGKLPAPDREGGPSDR